MGKSVNIRPIRAIRVRFRGKLLSSMGSLPAGLRQWRSAEGRGLGKSSAFALQIAFFSLLPDTLKKICEKIRYAFFQEGIISL